MRFVLTSNFPSAGNAAVAQHLRDVEGVRVVHWVAAAHDDARFRVACDDFAAIGLGDVRAATDAPPDLRTLHAGEAVYLSGGDPIAFRQSLHDSGFGRSIAQAKAAGSDGLIMTASGGAMQLTPNVSLFRLLKDDVESVIAQRESYAALACVPFEMLPHSQSHSPEFMRSVHAYSAQTDSEIVLVPDGSALCVDARGATRHIGPVSRLHRGHLAS
jgi:peptidase E